MWIDKYVQAFVSSPLATLVSSLALIAILSHFLIPLACEARRQLKGYWDRYETPMKPNWYVELIPNRGYYYVSHERMRAVQIKDLPETELRQYTGSTTKWVLCREDGRSYLRTGLKTSTPLLTSAIYFPSKAKAEAMYEKESYAFCTGLLGGTALLLTGLALVLDLLLFSYFFQTVVVLLVGVAVTGVLLGGRYAADINKKFDKLDKATDKAAE